VSRARLSIVFYSIYLAGFGAVTALMPNLVLMLAHQPQSTQIWVRLCGVLTFVLGAKELLNSRLEIAWLFQLTVYTRWFVATVITILVLFAHAPPILLVLAAIDYGAALWTQIAIRSDRRHNAASSELARPL
jgi:hypothetical protein